MKPGDVRRAAAPCSPALKSATCSNSRRCSTSSSGACPKRATSLSRIQNLLIDAPNGSRVQLKDVADVRVVPSPTVIKRETVARYVEVGATVEGRNVAAVAGDVESRSEGN